jgi:hypothetical protein
MLKIHRTLMKLEEQKYLEPLITQAFEGLITHLKKNNQYSTSNSTIMMSQSAISGMIPE